MKALARPAPGLLAAALALLAVAAPAAAQEGFLFRQPKVMVGLDVGWAFPAAGSQVFDFTREQLTVDRGDFAGPAVAGSVEARVTERVNVGVELGYSARTASSESRRFMGTDDLPILQETRLSRGTATLNAKLFLQDGGRSISEFAWVPVSTWNPYVGAGGGMVWYEFVQEGEFVDFETLDIFLDRFASDGSAPVGHVMGGVLFSAGPRLVFDAEARYSWSTAEMTDDFAEFEDIDLGGFQVTFGAAIRF